MGCASSNQASADVDIAEGTTANPDGSTAKADASFRKVVSQVARRASALVLSLVEPAPVKEPYEDQLEKLRRAQPASTSLCAQKVDVDEPLWTGAWAQQVGLASLAGATRTNQQSAPQYKVNQDFGLVTHPFCGSETRLLVGVYDGHGEEADAISRTAAILHAEILQIDMAELGSGGGDGTQDTIIDAASGAGVTHNNPFISSFGRVDAELLERCPQLYYTAGTTAIVASLNLDSSLLEVGCVGDSRCVKGSAAGGRSGGTRTCMSAVLRAGGAQSRVQLKSMHRL